MKYSEERNTENFAWALAVGLLLISVGIGMLLGPAWGVLAAGFLLACLGITGIAIILDGGNDDE